MKKRNILALSIVCGLVGIIYMCKPKENAEISPVGPMIDNSFSFPVVVNSKNNVLMLENRSNQNAKNIAPENMSVLSKHDVTVDVSQCKNLDSGKTCALLFNLNSTEPFIETFTVQGQNTNSFEVKISASRAVLTTVEKIAVSTGLKMSYLIQNTSNFTATDVQMVEKGGPCLSHLTACSQVVANSSCKFEITAGLQPCHSTLEVIADSFNPLNIPISVQATNVQITNLPNNLRNISAGESIKIFVKNNSLNTIDKLDLTSSNGFHCFQKSPIPQSCTDLKPGCTCLFVMNAIKDNNICTDELLLKYTSDTNQYTHDIHISVNPDAH